MLEFKIEKAMFKQEILVVESLIQKIVFGMDFLYEHNAAICENDGIEIELESKNQQLLIINTIMIEREMPYITNCTPEMD